MKKKKTEMVDELCNITKTAEEIIAFLGGKNLSFMEMRKALKAADGIIDASITIDAFNYSLQKILTKTPED